MLSACWETEMFARRPSEPCFYRDPSPSTSSGSGFQKQCVSAPRRCPLVFPRYPIRAFSPQNQCYTSRFPHMLKTALHRYFFAPILLTLAIGAAAPQSAPSPLIAAAGELAQQILSRGGSPSAVAVTFQNVSTLSAEMQEAVQNAVFRSFRNAGGPPVNPEAQVADENII